MKRREFIITLCAAAFWPGNSYAQQPVTPLVGFLGGGTSEGFEFFSLPLFAKAFGKVASSKERIWFLRPAGQPVNSTDCRL